MSLVTTRASVTEASRPAPQLRTIASSLAATRFGQLATKRRLQLGLALLWALDGALQLQPFMFTRGFATQIIAPSASGQPTFVADAVHWSSALIAAHPLAWDLLFALVQLAIGVAFAFRRTVRPAIVVSVAWALGVWLLGEGLGGVAGGTGTFLTGAPGAVLLYALIGLAAWPRIGEEARGDLISKSSTLRTRTAALLAPVDDERPSRWVPALWALLWLLLALLQALPANASARGLADQVQMNVASAPGWIAHADHVLGTAASGAGMAPVVALIVLEVSVGLGGMWQTSRRVAAGVGILLALAAWVLPQALGQIPSGMGTDPNTGPLIVLLAIALLGRAGAGRVTLEERAQREHAVVSTTALEAA